MSFSAFFSVLFCVTDLLSLQSLAVVMAVQKVLETIYVVKILSGVVACLTGQHAAMLDEIL